MLYHLKYHKVILAIPYDNPRHAVSKYTFYPNVVVDFSVDIDENDPVEIENRLNNAFIKACYEVSSCKDWFTSMDKVLIINRERIDD